MSESLPLGPAFSKALAYAAHLHGAHTRKGSGIPYVSHLLSVCALTLEDGGSETEAIAALLHDAAEDHGGARRLTEIRREFGDDVGDIVQALSDSLAEDPDAKAPWRPRKEDYLAHLELVRDERILRVSCADKLHNARSILADLHVHGNELFRRFTTGADDPAQGRRDQEWYLGALAEIYARHHPGRLASELCQTVDAIAAHPPTPTA